MFAKILQKFHVIWNYISSWLTALADFVREIAASFGG